MDVDVVVIGAGVVGLACARELAARGHSVVILERHERFGVETSSRNSEVAHAGINRIILSEAMGLVVFGVGIVLLILGIIIIILREMAMDFVRHLQARIRAKVRDKQVGPWEFLLQLLEEIFAVIKELPAPLRVAFLLIIFGIILLILGYGMAIGYWPPLG